jgi:hypothetical protein
MAGSPGGVGDDARRYRSGIISSLVACQAPVIAAGCWVWLCVLVFRHPPHVLLASTGAVTFTLTAVALAARSANDRAAADRPDIAMRAVVEMSWETLAAALRSSPDQAADSGPEQRVADVHPPHSEPATAPDPIIRRRRRDPSRGTGTLQNPFARCVLVRGIHRGPSSEWDRSHRSVSVGRARGRETMATGGRSDGSLTGGGTQRDSWIRRHSRGSFAGSWMRRRTVVGGQ